MANIVYMAKSAWTGLLDAIRSKASVSGTMTVSQATTAVENIETGGGESRVDLLATKSLGALSTSSTSEVSTGQTLEISKADLNGYEMALVICSVDTQVNDGHVATLGMTMLYGDSYATSINSVYQPTVKENYRLSSNKVVSRANNTAYGVYAKGEYSSSKLTLTFYTRYNSSYTGTINGSYTARVYGLKIYDLIV